MQKMTLPYPKALNAIFNTLQKQKITPIIVGGYVRDFFLGLESKDIDIELYGVGSLQEVEQILEEFGDINTVGKSFAVVKLRFKKYEIDFSLPRKESKTAKGHRGFEVVVDKSLTFAAAAQRRDFTINTIGYNPLKEEFLDPYNGRDDIKKQLLQAVSLKTFGEDPLRVLRAVVFSSRFDFTIEHNLFVTMKKMVDEKTLRELPKERVFEEIQKIALKSPTPSSAFKIMRLLEIKAFGFAYLFSLESSKLAKTYQAIDTFAKHRSEAKSKEEIETIFFALLTSQMRKPLDFLEALSHEKKLLKKVLLLQQSAKELHNGSDKRLYLLAKKIELRHLFLYLQAIKCQKNIEKLQKRAKELGILTQPLPPLLKGRDLLALGIKSGPEFKKILDFVYELQIEKKCNTKEEALEIVKKHFLGLL